MSKSIQELLSGLPAWETALTEDGYIDGDNRVTIKEAFASPDAAALFPTQGRLNSQLDETLSQMPIPSPSQQGQSCVPAYHWTSTPSGVCKRDM